MHIRWIILAGIFYTATVARCDEVENATNQRSASFSQDIRFSGYIVPRHSDGPIRSITTEDVVGLASPKPDVSISVFARRDEVPIRTFKKQAVQSVSVTGGWLKAIGVNDLSSSFFETSIGVGIPLGNFDNILGVTPSFRMDFMDAAAGIDIPSTLYETGVSFFWRRPLNDRWSLMLLGGPSIRSDMTTGDNALRLFGMALLTWDARPDNLAISMGVVFLGRADLPALPAVGLKWTPSPRTKLNLQFPESTLSYRLEKDGGRSELWAYTSIGFGGNTWAVTRASGLTDELSTRDLRLTIGVERIVDGGGGWLTEVGYAFARRIEYENTQTEVELNDGLLVQAGWKY